MIKRKVYDKLSELAKYYEVIAVTGPRQCGKTTLLRDAYPDYEYFNFEQISVRDMVEADIQGFINKNNENVIFDEVQNIPQILSYIQVIIDEKRFNGMSKCGSILISGSQNILLSNKISQSLAGRAAYLEMLPFSQDEIPTANRNIYKKIFEGSFPAKIIKNIPSDIFYQQYISTYLERDVREIKNIENLNVFRRFIALVAGRVGQIVDYTSLSNDVGVSVNTIKNWFSVLEASYLIFTLQPYYNNFGKRFIKSPKVYFTDTGIVCQLLGITDEKMLKTHPLVGNLFENYCILEILKTIKNEGSGESIYYYRNTNGNEVDLIIQCGETLKVCEIKLGSTFTSSFTKGIKYFNTISKGSHKLLKNFLIYTGKKFEMTDIQIVNIDEVNHLLKL